jgi:hypothetical protein
VGGHDNLDERKVEDVELAEEGAEEIRKVLLVLVLEAEGCKHA